MSIICLDFFGSFDVSLEVLVFSRKLSRWSSHSQLLAWSFSSFGSDRGVAQCFLGGRGLAPGCLRLLCGPDWGLCLSPSIPVLVFSLLVSLVVSEFAFPGTHLLLFPRIRFWTLKTQSHCLSAFEFTIFFLNLRCAFSFQILTPLKLGCVFQ